MYIDKEACWEVDCQCKLVK